MFFYQSPFGSRVFFDELGPPWPKHPCTDNPAAKVGAMSWGTAAAVGLPRRASQPSWHAGGWIPIDIERVDQDGKWWIVRGHRADDGTLVRFLVGQFIATTKNAAAFYRPNAHLATVEISYFPSTFEQSTAPCEIAGFRLDQFHRFSPKTVLAAMAGDPQKASDLGYLLSFAIRDEEANKPKNGTSISRFPDKIHWVLVRWLFEKASAGGEHVATHNLRFMLFHGHGVQVDYDEAFRKLGLAQHLGIARTFDLLADCHAHGLGTRIDTKQAVEYRAKAKATRASAENGTHAART